MEVIAHQLNNDLHDWRGVGRRLNLARTAVFKLWRSGQLASVMVGGRRMSTDRQIATYITRLEASASTPKGAA